MARNEGKSSDFPETSYYLQQKQIGNFDQMELVIVNYLNFDPDGIPNYLLIQILPLPFQNWASSKIKRITREINFKKQNQEKYNQLTQRNKEILTHMVCCTKAEDISDQLEISVNTVNTHKKKIKDILVLEESCETLWYGLAFDLL